ncbi:hypothetical protein HYFRA_00010317 [Hymenoscyphus fraxineus]|uniref:Uncharacterized protein n=1 Tax=Hymenoscyphus fraxineus TaxID=746836 RepID=A0A9N9KX01_9HELO|nr:hypothetical protein HYFRA_00010317 [Hymenoscyphus fraxineus]
MGVYCMNPIAEAERPRTKMRILQVIKWSRCTEKGNVACQFSFTMAQWGILAEDSLDGYSGGLRTCGNRTVSVALLIIMSLTSNDQSTTYLTYVGAEK